jgi:hypothetical protein
MGKLLKKSRLTLAVVLLAQAVTLFFLFILQVGKRRSLAEAFLAVSAFEATAGGYLFWQLCEEQKESKECRKMAQEMAEDPDHFEIPLDEKANERDFR